ncbi:hypothetical protein DH2020_037257 [Rehmannia glutinosa]|uniref:tRNA (guanine(26)-N(2))-dimethyltransferase n=1 Tax=Rehmannia glutinosa TaxID=99300 RepID=A0ABR0V314_REHGL
MAGSDEKIGDEEKHHTGAPVVAPFDLNDFTVIKEGEAEILMHVKNEVFYNKTQVNNRDMSIAVLRTFISKRKEEHEAMLSRKRKTGPKDSGEPIVEPESLTDNVMHDEKSNGECEALSASGLRAIRYAREVDGIGQVVALDNDKVSVESCRRNIKFNGSVACSKVESNLADARVYMLTHPKEFDVVDLDPYGSPSVFLDSAVQSVVDGGILMCTATDMAVLCGGNGEVCYSKYGSYPLRGKYCHEMALRILLACIESHANRYKRYIVPVLSVQMDFYVRVFVRIYTSASAMKNTPLKLSYVYQCTGCDSFHLQPIGRTVSKNTSVRYLPGFGPVVAQECSDCGKKYNMGGPIWSAPIHDLEWVTSILADVKSMKDRYPAFGRISAVLTTISEELPDVPLFLSLHNLCATLKCTSPSAVIFRSAVINAGYRISEVIINVDVGVEVKNHPVKAQPPDQAGSVILAKEPDLQANFARAVASLSKAQAKKVARFLPNPERYWGPKVRAGRQITSKHVSLLGAEAINGMHNHDQNEEEPSLVGAAAEAINGMHSHDESEEEPSSKRKKTEESTSNL